MDTPVIIIFMVIIVTALANTAFKNIFDNTSQQHVEHWSNIFGRVIKEYFECYFYFFLPRAEVALIAVAALGSILETVTHVPEINLAVMLYCGIKILVVVVVSPFFLKQHQIIQYFIGRCKF
jgi:hypothetical protein